VDLLGFLPYSGQNVALVGAQAALVALPAAGLPVFARRFAGRAWSLVLPLSIAIVVAVLAVLPGAASGLTWLSLVAVPLLAAAAVGWAMHGARPWLAVLGLPVFVLAVAYEGERIGQIAALLLTALSCVTLGRLLAGVVGEVSTDGAAAGWWARRRAARGGDGAPGATAEAGAPRRSGTESSALARVTALLHRHPMAPIRIALVAMAVIDAILVFSGGLEAPNNALNAAAPSAELPRLQFLQLNGASMGYGDVFVAGVLGAVLAFEGARRRLQLAAAGATLVLSLLFDLLFALDSIRTLPATVPVAVATLLFGGFLGRSGGRDDEPAPAVPAPRPLSRPQGR
jgi:prepilin signal peptidase PulO-like enzyme (type II secretory pathway)